MYNLTLQFKQNYKINRIHYSTCSTTIIYLTIFVHCCRNFYIQRLTGNGCRKRQPWTENKNSSRSNSPVPKTKKKKKKKNELLRNSYYHSFHQPSPSPPRFQFLLHHHLLQNSAPSPSSRDSIFTADYYTFPRLEPSVNIRKKGRMWKERKKKKKEG